MKEQQLKQILQNDGNESERFDLESSAHKTKFQIEDNIIEQIHSHAGVVTEEEEPQ